MSVARRARRTCCYVILRKALEAILATRLTYLADTHGLLPSRHTGGRKLTSTDYAIHLLLQSIHKAWAKKKVASLLLLDVSGAFDNVSRPRLLHNLRKRRTQTHHEILKLLSLFKYVCSDLLCERLWRTVRTVLTADTTPENIGMDQPGG